jgi:hypothetical protein
VHIARFGGSTDPNLRLQVLCPTVAKKRCSARSSASTIGVLHHQIDDLIVREIALGEV